MEVPSPQSGTVEELKVKVGDRVSEGSPILTLATTTGSEAEAKTPVQPQATPAALATESVRS